MLTAGKRVEQISSLVDFLSVDICTFLITKIVQQIRMKNILKSYIFLFMIFLMSLTLHAESIKIDWLPPLNTNNITGYKIYYGDNKRTYNISMKVGIVTNYMVDNLIDHKTYYFAITAYDKYNNESPYSDEMTLDYDPPIIPTNHIFLTNNIVPDLIKILNIQDNYSRMTNMIISQNPKRGEILQGNLISVTAIDEAGNSATKQLNVFPRTPLPIKYFRVVINISEL